MNKLVHLLSLELGVLQTCAFAKFRTWGVANLLDLSSNGDGADTGFLKVVLMFLHILHACCCKS